MKRQRSARLAYDGGDSFTDWRGFGNTHSINPGIADRAEGANSVDAASFCNCALLDS